MAPASSVSQACPLRMNDVSSWRPVAWESPGQEGTKVMIIATVTAEMTAVATNAVRHPACWPSQVAAGTPRTLATDSPSITAATQRPVLPGGARLAATSEATPK
jgi:hypothetical protein